MVLLVWTLFGVASLVYAGTAYFALRAALVYGHHGDLTLPVTFLFSVAAVALWLTSLVMLVRLDLPGLTAS